MGVNIVLDDFYTTGSMSPPNVVITLKNLEDKREIFRNISKIKNFVNRDGVKVQIRDFYTPEQNEVHNDKG